VGERADHYEEIRARLEQVTGEEVRTVHYLEADDLSAEKAVVLSGSFAPWAQHERGALDRLGEAVLAYQGAVLGICAGMQLMARFAGGAYAPAENPPQTGFGAIEVIDDTDLLRGLPARPSVYKHHTEEVVDLPAGFRVLARSSECAVEAISDPARRWWGTQFHPERFDADHPAGERVLRNFFELARL
jgi:GMP synthase (glutamine-hydrolysing)